MSYRLTQSLRTALPNLVKAVQPAPGHLPFPILRASPVASTSRLFSSSPKSQLTFKSATGLTDSVWATAAKRFSSGGARGIANASPAYRANAGQQVDWTKVATNVGIVSTYLSPGYHIRALTARAPHPGCRRRVWPQLGAEPRDPGRSQPVRGRVPQLDVQVDSGRTGNYLGNRLRSLPVGTGTPPHVC